MFRIHAATIIDSIQDDHRFERMRHDDIDYDNELECQGWLVDNEQGFGDHIDEITLM